MALTDFIHPDGEQQLVKVGPSLEELFRGEPARVLGREDDEPAGYYPKLDRYSVNIKRRLTISARKAFINSIQFHSFRRITTIRASVRRRRRMALSAAVFPSFFRLILASTQIPREEAISISWWEELTFH